MIHSNLDNFLLFWCIVQSNFLKRKVIAKTIKTSFYGFIEFFYQSTELKGTDALEERTVPVPQTSPALCDSAVITFSGGNRILGEPQRRG